VFTLDTAKPSSLGIADKLHPHSYLCIILTFISKSMAVHLRDYLLFLSGVEISCNGEKGTSAPREIKYGVPQDSVLGPILFLLHINDPPLNIKEVFPDDTKILVTAEKGQNLQKKINKVMSELDGGFNANSLILNTEKTIAMAFHNRQERLDETAN
jgi:hypothetical protein